MSSVNYLSYYNKVFELMIKHHNWMSKTINLIASENIVSPAVREAMISDFHNRYAEGWPGERVYAGCKYIDQVELLTIELAKKIFNAEFVDVRPISGVVANLVVYTAFTEPGDVMMSLSIPCGGHISTGKKELWGTAGIVHGLNVEYFPYDVDELNIDVDATIKILKNGKKTIKLLMFGASVFPFPHPVKEIAPIAHDLGIVVAYDAAHVLGLIAGGFFQDPLREGADVISASTHKTLPGPQHGIVISWNKYSDLIKKSSFPGLLSNHHLHNVAALCIALSEIAQFGREYAAQIIKNARALAQALHERGLKVLGEKRGFTESHVILLDTVASCGIGGREAEGRLENSNIIVNRNLLPYDLKKYKRHYTDPGGIRLGTAEVTRLGMKESDMEIIADFITDVLIKNKPSTEVSKSVTEFRRNFNKCHYCFDSVREAYEYIKLK